MNTPTPRTDAAANESIVKVYETSLQLETELTAAREELKAVTEQRDRMAEALERILAYQGRFAEEDPESIAKEALQSLTKTEL